MATSDVSATTIWFADPQATDLSAVGGKGANLGRLTQAGFVVPPGFVVGTAAYEAHIKGLNDRISAVLSKVNYDDPEALEASVSEIRSWITAAAMPGAVADEIARAYGKLGGDTYVAVRSSGTAEDLTGASFAGLHDTYLDIRGRDQVSDAVKRCWASLWTARATFYRKTQGFDHLSTSIAVVVQTMVESEVSGVMFTTNPINTATDQIVINASWGLGEAVVSGIVTPDEFIVRHKDLKVLNRTLGTKEVRIVRDTAAGNGTVKEIVPEHQRTVFTFSPDQVSALAELGRRIQDAYAGFPQDIEWAYQAGKFYLLQARPITSVEFSWDADVTDSVQGNDDSIAWDEIWSRNFPEEMWTGAITPLMFSSRCWGLNQWHSVRVRALGYPELDYTTRRLWAYYKGVSYYNCRADLDLIKTAVPPPLRAGLLEKIPKAWHEEALNAPFDWGRYLESFQRIEKNRPDMGYNWWKAIRDDYIESAEYRAKTRARTQDELRAMSDAELKQHIATLIRIEAASFDPPGNGLLYYMRDALGWMGWIIANWYDGGRANIFMDLVTGTRNPTITTEENYSVWALAEAIRVSPELSSLFDKYPDLRFFDHLDRCLDGPKFRALYQAHIRAAGHRGHSDRDIYFPRRVDNPMVDMRLFKALMGTPDPRIQERKMAAKLEETIQHVYDNLAKQPLGIFKAHLFRFLCDFAHNSIEFRDNEREVMDWSTYAIKSGFVEVNRRIREKELLTSDRDFYFLTMEELYDVLDGKANMGLTTAKIAVRMKNFDKVDKKEVHPSRYLQYGVPANVDAPAAQGEGVLRGKTTSVGKVTGTARVVRELAEIGRVQKGEILIVHATDPGWTPVFMVITGIVLETGGLISHGALLAREYGLPGVQIAGALELIPDGATITLDGDAGLVIIHDDGDKPSDLEKAA